MLVPGGANNLGLSWLVETGVVGLALLLATLAAMHLRIGALFVKKRSPRTFPRMLFAASALLLLHGITDSSLNIPAVAWLYALLLGCGCGLAAGQAKKSS